MIGYFPTPYPDELFYSICARYQDRLRPPDRAAGMQDLFNDRRFSINVQLPTRLETLVSNLPPDHPCTVDRLIDHHSLFPYYGAFIPTDRREYARDQMIADSKKRLNITVGITSSNIPALRKLRFCPVCLNEDIKTYGEGYWHRLHQILEVRACPIHEVMLDESTVEVERHIMRGYLIPTMHATEKMAPRSLKPANRQHRIMLEIAHDAAWLLSRPRLSFNPDSLFEKYRNTLHTNGFMHQNGNLQCTKIIHHFRNHYTPKTLDLFHTRSPATANKHWLIRMLRKTRVRYPLPIQHLLFVHFLGYTLESLMDPYTDFLCQGDTPPSLEVSESPKSEINSTKAPIKKVTKGRNYVDWERRDRKWAKIVRDAAARLINSPRRPERVSAEAIYREIGMTTLIKRNLKRLPLTKKALSEIVESSESCILRRIDWAVEQYIREDRMPVRTQFMHRAGVRYDRLSISPNIREALEQALETLEQSSIPTSSLRIDWDRRDRKFADDIRVAGTRLMNAPGRPKRVSATAIYRELDTGTLISRNLYRLPLTRQALSEVVESHEAIALRRIDWVVEQCIHEDRLPSRTTLMQRASIEYKYVAKSAKIEEAINDAVETLEQSALRPSEPTIDWENKDSELAEALKAKWERLLAQPGKPRRITKTALANDNYWIRKYPNKLPQVMTTLNQLVETYEGFAVRKIEWVAECYREEGHIPTRSQFIMRAGVFRKPYTESTHIMNAVEEALQILQETIDPTSDINVADLDKSPEEWVKVIKSAAENIRNLPGKPVRVTLGAIADRIGTYREYLRQRSSKLPLVQVALSEVIETHAAFTARRIEWAARLYFQENVCPTRKQILRRANARRESIATSPDVIEALDTAIEKLCHRSTDTP